MAAVFVALWFGVREIRDRRDTARRAQASMVAAWLPDSGERVVISNLSTLPVYEMLVTIRVNRTVNSDEYETFERVGYVNIVAPAPTVTLGSDSLRRHKGESIIEVLSTRFRDCSGLGWSRDNKGVLRQLVDPTLPPLVIDLSVPYTGENNLVRRRVVTFGGAGASAPRSAAPPPDGPSDPA